MFMWSLPPLQTIWTMMYMLNVTCRYAICIKYLCQIYIASVSSTHSILWTCRQISTSQDHRNLYKLGENYTLWYKASILPSSHSLMSVYSVFLVDEDAATLTKKATARDTPLVNLRSLCVPHVANNFTSPDCFGAIAVVLQTQLWTLWCISQCSLLSTTKVNMSLMAMSKPSHCRWNKQNATESRKTYDPYISDHSCWTLQFWKQVFDALLFHRTDHVHRIWFWQSSLS